VDDTVGPMEGDQIPWQLLADALDEAMPEGDEVRHELDVVDHEPARPEELVALVEDAPTEARQEDPKIRGQLSSESLLQAIQLELAGRLRAHVLRLALHEDGQGLLDRHG